MTHRNALLFQLLPLVTQLIPQLTETTALLEPVSPDASKRGASPLGSKYFFSILCVTIDIVSSLLYRMY